MSETCRRFPADRTQMVMVFQNLIGNAFKYRRVEVPRSALVRFGKKHTGAYLSRTMAKALKANTLRRSLSRLGDFTVKTFPEVASALQLVSG